MPQHISSVVQHNKNMPKKVKSGKKETKSKSKGKWGFYACTMSTRSHTANIFHCVGI